MFVKNDFLNVLAFFYEFFLSPVIIFLKKVCLYIYIYIFGILTVLWAQMSSTIDFDALKKLLSSLVACTYLHNI